MDPAVLIQAKEAENLAEHSGALMPFQWWLIATLLTIVGLLVKWFVFDLRRSVEMLAQEVQKVSKDVSEAVSRTERRLTSKMHRLETRIAVVEATLGIRRQDDEEDPADEEPA